MKAVSPTVLAMASLGSTAQQPLLQVTALRHYFDVSKPLLNRLLEGEGTQILKAVDGVSFDIARGRTFSLVGESGCGKSTIARCIAGLYLPTAGSVKFDGMEISAPQSRGVPKPVRRRIQMIFQDPYASLDPRWRVNDIVAEPIRTHGLQKGRKEIQRRVVELLEYVRLTERDGEKYPHEFSGGQRQRISIARALASNPEFIVCDEPTSALDVSVQAQILNLMMDLQRELGLTYLVISHNLAIVRQVSHDVGVMYLGRLVEQGDATALFEQPRHPYTRMLFDAVPDLEMTGRQRTPGVGEVPSPIDPPTGCAFHPRCPHARDLCQSETPILTMAGSHQVACHGAQQGWIPEEQQGFLTSPRRPVASGRPRVHDVSWSSSPRE